MSVGLSVSQWHFPFVRSFCITAPAQPHATDVVMYMALPLPSPLTPLWFLHNCPCPITWSWCCQVYGPPLPSTTLPLPPEGGLYHSCPNAREQFLHYCLCAITCDCIRHPPAPQRGALTVPAQLYASSFCPCPIKCDWCSCVHTKSTHLMTPSQFHLITARD